MLLDNFLISFVRPGGIVYLAEVLFFSLPKAERNREAPLWGWLTVGCCFIFKTQVVSFGIQGGDRTQ